MENRTLRRPVLRNSEKISFLCLLGEDGEGNGTPLQYSCLDKLNTLYGVQP